MLTYSASIYTKKLNRLHLIKPKTLSLVSTPGDQSMGDRVGFKKAQEVRPTGEI